MSRWILENESRNGVCVLLYISPMASPHKGQWRGAFMFSLICAWTNGWSNNRDAGDLRPRTEQQQVRGSVQSDIYIRIWQIQLPVSKCVLLVHYWLIINRLVIQYSMEFDLWLNLDHIIIPIVYGDEQYIVSLLHCFHRIKDDLPIFYLISFFIKICLTRITHQLGPRFTNGLLSHFKFDGNFVSLSPRF